MMSKRTWAVLVVAAALLNGAVAWPWGLGGGAQEAASAGATAASASAGGGAGKKFSADAGKDARLMAQLRADMQATAAAEVAAKTVETERELPPPHSCGAQLRLPAYLDATVGSVDLEAQPTLDDLRAGGYEYVECVSPYHLYIICVCMIDAARVPYRGHGLHVLMRTVATTSPNACVRTGMAARTSSLWISQPHLTIDAHLSHASAGTCAAAAAGTRAAVRWAQSSATSGASPSRCAHNTHTHARACP